MTDGQIEDRSAELSTLRGRLDKISSYLHINQKRAQIAELDAKAAQPCFWDDSENAQALMGQVSALRGDVFEYDGARAILEDAEVANELAVEENDAGMASEVDEAVVSLSQRIDSLELSSWFTGTFDGGDAIVTVTPGAGGLEAQDWTEMLFRMYLKYAERKRWRVTVNDAPPGEAIGLDRATFTVSGHNAYGMLKSEQGVHRLVRISPTDDKKRRHTTFAGVEVLPVIPDDIEVNIDEDDIRVDVYHSSGHGGQGVNTTDSAVRLTHLPTGIVVTCQNERSQIQNKATAMGILRSKLYELEEQRRARELDELRGPKREISFGSQIRNYVLYPYQMVKDVRTGVETGNVDAVFDGDLDQFVVAYHRWITSQR